MRWKSEERKKAGHEMRMNGVKETRQLSKVAMGSLSWHTDKAMVDQRSSASKGLFTFTISWARIPPTTAHTGAISEKQYLEEKTNEMEPRGRGRLGGHLTKVSSGLA